MFDSAKRGSVLVLDPGLFGSWNSEKRRHGTTQRVTKDDHESF
jgi:hypothetical protein